MLNHYLVALSVKVLSVIVVVGRGLQLLEQVQRNLPQKMQDLPQLGSYFRRQFVVDSLKVLVAKDWTSPDRLEDDVDEIDKRGSSLKIVWLLAAHSILGSRVLHILLNMKR